MSGSGASIIGYGNTIPNSNINPSYVNVDASSYAGGLSSNEIPQSTLFASKNNVDAANSIIPCFSRGGGRRKNKKTMKQKIKNIVKMYRMTKASKKSFKRKLSKMLRKSKSKTQQKKRSRKGRTQRRRRRYRGGYSQYQNNMPLTPSYSLGGNLAPPLSALANPPPVTVLSGCANCSDNYNHFLGSSFQSRGWGAK